MHSSVIRIHFPGLSVEEMLPHTQHCPASPWASPQTMPKLQIPPKVTLGERRGSKGGGADSKRENWATFTPVKDLSKAFSKIFFSMGICARAAKHLVTTTKPEILLGSQVLFTRSCVKSWFWHRENDKAVTTFSKCQLLHECPDKLEEKIKMNCFDPISYFPTLACGFKFSVFLFTCNFIYFLHLKIYPCVEAIHKKAYIRNRNESGSLFF